MAERSQSASRRSYWPRFTLRLLLAVLTVLCIWLGIHTHRAREQKRIVRRIELSSGRVSYDYESPGTFGPFGPPGEAASSVPPWLLDRLGVDFFHSVVAAHILDPGDLPDVCRLDTLRRLVVSNAGANDADVLHVARLANLRELTINSGRSYPSDRPTRLTDRSLAIVGQMPNIQSVDLYCAGFTAGGIETLAENDMLTSVVLHGCRDDVDAAAALPFRKSGRVRRLELSGWPPDFIQGAWPPRKTLITSW